MSEYNTNAGYVNNLLINLYRTARVTKKKNPKFPRWSLGRKLWMP